MSRSQTTLTELARLGFAELESASERLSALGSPELVPHFATAADPDQALLLLGALRERAPEAVASLAAVPDAIQNLTDRIPNSFLPSRSRFRRLF